MKYEQSPDAELYYEDYDPSYDEDRVTCGDCPDDECTGHCMSCPYRS